MSVLPSYCHGYLLLNISTIIGIRISSGKKNLSSNEISGTYHFLKTWDGYQMSKETYQPLSVQNNRALVPYDESQVMIEVQHCVKLVFVFYEANFPGKRLELYYI